MPKPTSLWPESAPDLAFWYHIGPDEVLDMPNNIRGLYEEALPRLKAELELMMCNSSMVVWADKSDRSSHINRLVRTVNNGREDDTPPPVPETLDDLQTAVAQHHIGLVLVDADGNETALVA